LFDPVGSKGVDECWVGIVQEVVLLHSFASLCVQIVCVCHVTEQFLLAISIASCTLTHSTYLVPKHLIGYCLVSADFFGKVIERIWAQIRNLVVLDIVK